MLLSAEEIHARLALPRTDPRRLVIVPSPAHIGPASVDLRLADEFLRVNAKTNSYERVRAESMVLHQNEFVLASTLEAVHLPPDVAGRLEGRSSLGRVGLNVHQTAGFIDPGFEGRITFELSNDGTTSMQLPRGLRVAQLTLYSMIGEADYVPRSKPGELLQRIRHISKP